MRGVGEGVGGAAGRVEGREGRREGGGGGAETRGGILNCFDSAPELIGRTTPTAPPGFLGGVVCSPAPLFLSIVFPSFCSRRPPTPVPEPGAD